MIWLLVLISFAFCVREVTGSYMKASRLPAPSLLVALLATLIFASTASAALILHIDTTAKKFWLSGSATGKFGSYNGGNATWAYSSSSVWTTNGLIGTPSLLVNNSNGVPITRVAIGNPGGASLSIFSRET